MNKEMPRKVIDVTGVELTPANPKDCLGNGEHGYECCCDESDYFLLCFPNDAEEIVVDDTIEISYSHRHKVRMNRFFREVVGSPSFLPFPEVDNAFEHLRSKIVIKFAKNKKK